MRNGSSSNGSSANGKANGTPTPYSATFTQVASDDPGDGAGGNGAGGSEDPLVSAPGMAATVTASHPLHVKLASAPTLNLPFASEDPASADPASAGPKQDPAPTAGGASPAIATHHALRALRDPFLRNSCLGSLPTAKVALGAGAVALVLRRGLSVSRFLAGESAEVGDAGDAESGDESVRAASDAPAASAPSSALTPTLAWDLSTCPMRSAPRSPSPSG